MTGADTPGQTLVLTVAITIVTVRTTRFDRESRSGRAVPDSRPAPTGDRESALR